jgi:DegV family protein with EDD domain
MFQVFVDSAANIPAEIVRKYGINVISFENYVNDEKIVNFDINLTPEEERALGKKYYDAVRGGAKVKTSLINSSDFIDHFKPVVEQGQDFIYVCLSKNISGTYNSAKLAIEDIKESFPDRRMHIVDSLNASLAQGILALYAVEMREKGMDIDKIAQVLSETAYRMNGVFTVEDLKYLARTGRISGTTAAVGNVLNIKPILRGDKEGFIVQFSKCRGRKKSLDTLIELVCNNIVEPEKQIIGIAHADAYEESLYVMEGIQKRVKLREFINTSYDYCTGSHVGPSTIALFFIANDRELAGKPSGDDYVMPEVFKYI